MEGCKRRLGYDWSGLLQSRLDVATSYCSYECARCSQFSGRRDSATLELTSSGKPSNSVWRISSTAMNFRSDGPRGPVAPDTALRGVFPRMLPGFVPNRFGHGSLIPNHYFAR